MKKKNKREDKNHLKLVHKYENDDYSRFSTHQDPNSNFELGVEKENVLYPEQHVWSSGISGGPTRNNYFGIGPKGYKRSDDRIYEDICELLMSNSDLDASEIVVMVENGIVHLSGKVIDGDSKRLVDFLLEDITGVNEVHNELIVMQSREKLKGPTGVTKNDLGLN